MVSHAFLSFLHQGGRGRQMPVSLMPAWSTASFPGQPRLHVKLSLSTQFNLLENCPCPQRLQRSGTILEAETQNSADSKAAGALLSDPETPELQPIISVLYVSTSLHYSVTIAWNWPRRGTIQNTKPFLRFQWVLLDSHSIIWAPEKNQAKNESTSNTWNTNYK